MTGRIHSFETFAAADGPGVRFAVFLAGCPFRCAYCHNPDTWARPATFEMSPEDVLRKALRYRAYWGAEGGITVSGGEPMLQADFVAELFERAHAVGVTTCLDTAAGPFRAENLSIQRLLAATDTVLLDLKHIDDAAHRNLTGASNAPVLACARHLSDIGIDTWIRHVLVPGLTTDESALRRLAGFIATLKNVRRVEVLPYHAFGVEKWKLLGLPYRLDGVEPPTPEQVARAREILEVCAAETKTGQMSQ